MCPHVISFQLTQIVICRLTPWFSKTSSLVYQMILYIPGIIQLPSPFILSLIPGYNCYFPSLFSNWLTSFLFPVPCRVSLRQCLAHWKEKIGHTTIDLGIAPNKLESYQDGDIKGTDPMERLVSVRGHLVSFPLDFMSREDLRPMFNESEYYASPQVFH